MGRIDTSEIIERCVRLIREDGPYKSLNASPYLSVCHALGVEPDGYKLPDCADVLRVVVRLAKMAERGR
ncbi:MAG TPA: hypothetical protein IAA15_07920 [Candidatus Olsenella pullicola]|nr:hypothetical protein [Candidatus Olsenella pullicola]